MPLLLYENSMFIKYSPPPRMMLERYKYIMFLVVYLMFLYPNEVIFIMMLIIILRKNNCVDVMFINNVKTDILPRKAPNNNLYVFVFLLNIMQTDKSNSKSNPKFKNNIKSIYIFNKHHRNNYKKKTQ